MRQIKRTRGRSSRPSNPSPGESAWRSCQVAGGEMFDLRPAGIVGMSVAVYHRAFAKLGDEHRWDILQEIFRFSMFKVGGVLLQLVSHLINDEAAVLCQSFISFVQQRTFLVQLQNAEGNSGENVVA